MSFLIKTVLIIVLVVALLPESGDIQYNNGENASSTTALQDTALFATEVGSDIWQICDRRQEACEAGGKLLSTIGKGIVAGLKSLLAKDDTQHEQNL